jgi:hypothetical protein
MVKKSFRRHRPDDFAASCSDKNRANFSLMQKWADKPFCCPKLFMAPLKILRNAAERRLFACIAQQH